MKLHALLRDIVGAANVLTDPQDTAPYFTDWRKQYSAAAECVVRPASTAEVASVVALCAREGVALVPQGGNTGLSGGSVPSGSRREIVLSLSRTSRIRQLDALNDTLTVEAGCVLAAVQKAAADAGRLFALSLAAEGSCQIGGNLSTNAGGVNVLRYGTARDQVLGLEVVLPDGRVWNGLRDAVLAQSGEQARSLWRLRESIPEAQFTNVKHDVSVPVSKTPELIERAGAALGSAFPGVRLYVFGHVGDGNLHYNVGPEALIAQREAVNRIVYDAVASLGGSISAEHGLGQLKRDEIRRHKDPLELELMRALKQTLDPRGLMNPGKLL